MNEFLKKVEQVVVVDTSKLNMFLLKDKALGFIKILSENPNFTQGKICKMMGTSDSTMRRIRKDLGMPSPFRYGTSKSKKSKKGRGLGEGVETPNILAGKSFYCTDCSKVFKSSPQNHVCKKKKKDVLASGAPGDEELEEVLNRGILP